LIRTLSITTIVESLVAFGYCRWQSKPLRSILLTSLLANVFTQSLLWTVVKIFFRYYIIALLVAEISIWIVESLALYFVRANELTFRQSIFLSFAMNLSSVLLGWLLPV
jgi:hypothetical protein